MAATHSPQRHYDYGYIHGPSSSSMNQSSRRSPSPSSRGHSSYDHSYSRQYDDRQSNNYQRDSDMIPTPDLRITAPSRAGDEMDDDQSMYSERMSAMTAPQNFYSKVFQSGVPSSSASSHHLSAFSSRSDVSRESWQTESAGSTRPDSNIDPFSFMQYESPRGSLPKVVVSSPSENSIRNRGSYAESAKYSDTMAIEPITPPPVQPLQGRVPSAVQGTRNFSRPSRPPAGPVPLPPPNTEEQKREVLERNQRRRMGPTSPNGSMNSLRGTPSSPLRPQRSQENLYDGIEDRDDIGSEYISLGRSRSASPSVASPQGPLPPLSQSSSTSSTSSQQQSPRTPQIQKGPVSLPSNPPDLRVRAETESVYSMYSYYQLDSASPSPSVTHFDQQGKGVHDGTSPSGPATQPSPKKQSNPSPSPSKSPNQPSPNGLPKNPTTPDDFLALGIAHHEANRLTESAQCFEKSATLNGGCAVGMLMWGLTLRHGWGVPKDEPRAFKWLKRAAEHAVVDLQHGSTKSGRDAVKNELVLAVYEVGQCFFQGWGVPRDKAMGVSYFQTAAQLGDPDAQQDLAFCLANGKGCKKDRKAAAKWYRAAAAQGASTVGLAWIYKPKYAD